MKFVVTSYIYLRSDRKVFDLSEFVRLTSLSDGRGRGRGRRGGGRKGKIKGVRRRGREKKGEGGDVEDGIEREGRR